MQQIKRSIGKKKIGSFSNSSGKINAKEVKKKLRKHFKKALKFKEDNEFEENEEKKKETGEYKIASSLLSKRTNNKIESLKTKRKKNTLKIISENPNEGE